MDRALAYIRVSTEEQVQSGISLEAQEHRIRAYCVANDYEFTGVFCDAGLSGKTLDRPQLQKALEMLRSKKADILVVLKLDRLSRSTRDVLELADRCQKEGWTLASLSEKLDTSSAAGRMVLSVLASMAQFEREQIGERTRTALQHMRAKGQLVGDIPYGHALAQDNFSLVPVPEEQAVIARIRELRARRVSYGGIAEALNAEGIPAKKGGKWWPRTVLNIHKANGK